ncbi:MAG: arylsulfatase, partial [Verrucomicrobiaceae bacterium]
MLVDDLGWSDLGCYGSEIPTPNLDALAANGVRFRQFYNSARCSPTRCSIMTGIYPQQGAVNPAAALPDLREDNNVTFAELLGSDGYR